MKDTPNLIDFDFHYGPLGRCYIRIGNKHFVEVDKQKEKEELKLLGVEK